MQIGHIEIRVAKRGLCSRSVLVQLLVLFVIVYFWVKRVASWCFWGGMSDGLRFRVPVFMVMVICHRGWTIDLVRHCLDRNIEDAG
ncbi:hypothetical protein J3F83DRAFT_744772 [Trichoderma novae-zelandiae]